MGRILSRRAFLGATGVLCLASSFPVHHSFPAFETLPFMKYLREHLGTERVALVPPSRTQLSALRSINQGVPFEARQVYVDDKHYGNIGMRQLPTKEGRGSPPISLIYIGPVPHPEWKRAQQPGLDEAVLFCSSQGEHYAYWAFEGCQDDRPSLANVPFGLA